MLIQIKVCDLCVAANPDSREEAILTRSIAIGNKKVEAEVCQSHDEKLTKQLDTGPLGVFLMVGRRVKTGKGSGSNSAPSPQPAPAPAANSTDEFECICGRSFNKQRGLSRHISIPGAAPGPHGAKNPQLAVA